VVDRETTRRGHLQGAYAQAVARALRPLRHPQAREAFLQTLPAALTVVLREFLGETEPCEMDDADWGMLLSRHSTRERRLSDAMV
jgi:hypothetical protein